MNARRSSTTALWVTAALALASCTTESVAPVDATPSSSESSGSAPSSSPSGRPSATTEPPGSTTITAVNLSTPGTAGPASVASLDVVTPESLGAALVAVDRATGAVSWWDGIVWKSYEVDAALDNQSWATDGHGGLLVQDPSGRVFHYQPYSDEPTLLLTPPPSDTNTFINLVGGGLLNGTSCAFVEQSTYDEPETSSGDIMCVDLDGRSDRTILENTSGWESGTGQIAIVDDVAVMTGHAECFTFIVTRTLGQNDGQTIVEGEDCAAGISGIGQGFFGAAAVAVVESVQTGFPATYLSHSLGEFATTSVTSMPSHTEGWYRITSSGQSTLVSSYGVAVIRDGTRWVRLDLAVPGEVAFADDLAIG